MDLLNKPELDRSNIELTLGVNSKELDNDPYFSTLIELAKEILIKGSSRDEVKRELLSQSIEDEKLLTDIELSSLVNRAARKLSDDYDKDREFVVSLHIARYNEDIDKQINVDISEMNKYRGKEVKNYAYLQALELLYQKEKVLGLHNKSVQIKINNVNNVKVSVRKKKYNFENLSLKEMIELNNLIEKSKKNEEVGSIILRPKEEKVEDIEFEEVKEIVEVVNIQQVQPTIIPPELLPAPEPKMFSDVQNRLKEALLKEAEEAFKRGKSK